MEYILACPHCGTELIVRDTHVVCPICGFYLALVKGHLEVEEPFEGAKQAEMAIPDTNPFTWRGWLIMFVALMAAALMALLLSGGCITPKTLLRTTTTLDCTGRPIVQVTTETTF